MGCYVVLLTVYDEVINFIVEYLFVHIDCAPVTVNTNFRIWGNRIHDVLVCDCGLIKISEFEGIEISEFEGINFRICHLINLYQLIHVEN